MNSPPTAGPDDTPPPGRTAGARLAARLAVQMFLAFAVQGAWMPVFSAYLDRLGFSPVTVAWSFAAYAISSLVAPVAWGQVADRWVPAERCIALCALAVGATLAVMPTSTTPWRCSWPARCSGSS
jgi:MFS family permease